MAECCRNTSHPISTSNGSPLATRKTIGIVMFWLVNSSETCFLTVLFCFPVAPIMIVLLIGKDVYKRQALLIAYNLVYLV